MLLWLKRNKLASVLLLIVAYFLFKTFFGVNFLSLNSRSAVYPSYEMNYSGSAPMGGGGGFQALTDSFSAKSIVPIESSVPPTTGTARMVVQNSSLSLVTKDVQAATDQIINFAGKAGGYMISSTLNQPEESPYATIELRIPSDKLKDSLVFFRTLAVKVTSENLYGTDVTDQYVDIDTRLSNLARTKTKYEAILTDASRVADILEVTREIDNLQNQIDSYKGQQLYLEKTAALAHVTLYLSSDEFALPYAPTDSFRPAVIFKLAVRSLVSTARGLATKAIWLAVYAVIWVPVLLVILYFRRRRNRLPKL